MDGQDGWTDRELGRHNDRWVVGQTDRQAGWLDMIVGDGGGDGKGQRCGQMGEQAG